MRPGGDEEPDAAVAELPQTAGPDLLSGVGGGREGTGFVDFFFLNGLIFVDLCIFVGARAISKYLNNYHFRMIGVL